METYFNKKILLVDDEKDIINLREKIEDNPSNPKILITVKGLGYKLVNRVD